MCPPLPPPPPTADQGCVRNFVGRRSEVLFRGSTLVGEVWGRGENSTHFGQSKKVFRCLDVPINYSRNEDGECLQDVVRLVCRCSQTGSLYEDQVNAEKHCSKQETSFLCQFSIWKINRVPIYSFNLLQDSQAREANMF